MNFNNIKRRLQNRLRKPPMPKRYLHARAIPFHYVGWGALAATLLCIAFVFQAPQLKLRRFTCRMSNNDTCPSAIIAQLNRYQGHNTLFIDLYAIKQTLRSAYPNLAHINESIQFPHTINITLHTKASHAAVKTSPESSALIIAKDMTITDVRQLANPDFPVIIYGEAYQLSVGEPITDPTLLFALDVAWQLKEGFVPYSQMTIMDPETILVDLPDGQAAVFSSALDSTRQVNSLQLILSKAKINQDLNVIDVRFNQPVLKREL